MIGRSLRNIRPKRDWWLAGAAVALLSIVASSQLGESDVFWEIRSGLDIWHSHHIPSSDPYSWTAAGAVWHPNSWGFDVLAAFWWHLGGRAGVGIFIGLLAAGTSLLLLLRARKAGASLTAGTIVLLGLGVFAIPIFWSRPVAASALCIVGFVLLLEAAATASGRRRWQLIAWLAALQVIWVNLHSQALIAIPVAGVFVTITVFTNQLNAQRAGRLWQSAARAVGNGIAAAVGLVLVSCCTPRGWAIYTDAAHVRAQSVGIISEWDSILKIGAWPVFTIWLFLAIIVAVRRHRYASAGMILLLTAATFSADRFLLPALLLSQADLALGLDGIGRRYRVEPHRGPLILAGVIIALFAYGPATARGLLHPGSLSSTDSLAAVHALPTGCRVLDEYSDGGLIILERHGQILVSMDGRNDVYGKQRVLHNQALLHVDAGTGPTVAAIQREHITCVLAYPKDEINHLLQATSGWQEPYHDAKATVWVYHTS